MKWFQVDSDTPSDPKIATVIRQMGAEGFGALVLLWCHIADHGARKPGWSINSKGKPMPEAELVEASRLTAEQFSRLVMICTSSGHFLRKPWETRGVIAIPAMSRRADTYTRRMFKPTSNKVGETSPTRQDIPSSTNTPLTPLAGGRITRAERKRAEQVRKTNFGCRHEPRCGSTNQCIALLVAAERSQAVAS